MWFRGKMKWVFRRAFLNSAATTFASKTSNRMQENAFSYVRKVRRLLMQFNMQLWSFSSLVLKCAPFVFPPSVYGEATIKRVRGNALHARKPNAPKASVFPKNMSRWKENYSFLY